MLVSQIMGTDGRAHLLARREGEPPRIVSGATSLYGLAQAAIAQGRTLSDLILASPKGAEVDLRAALAEGRALPPIMHPDPCHLHLTGTGLTHLGSAAARHSMHLAGATQDDAGKTDSMKLFELGISGGKPEGGGVGVQPEWFYKGNGHHLVAPGAALVSPSFALDGSEEPEIAGVYVVAPDGTPFRVGFALANEFSDHVSEKLNYLYLAHSKLRQASIGPEIRIGDPPLDVEGRSRIAREGVTVWERPFLSGEHHMSHSYFNLEHHHFKYELFRQPGDVHVHMFGTSTLSFADGITTQPGDVFEIEAPGFGFPLRNRLEVSSPPAVTIRQL